MRRRQVVPIAAALVGLLLFTYAIRSVGWSTVVDAVRSVGWWMLAILALSGVRFVLRAAAWRLCMPAHSQFSLAQAFAAFLSGDAVGNVTPLGLFASEPTKVLLIRHRLATREAVSSLAVDVMIYSTSAVTMIAVGLALLLVSVELSLGQREVFLAVIGVLAASVLFVLRMLGGSPRTEGVERPGWRGRLDSLRASVTAFSAGHPARLWQIFGLDLLFQAVAVAEVYLTLVLLLPTDPPTVVEAIIFGALDRFVVIAFKFVPLRLGIDEWLSGVMARILTLPLAVGVSLALVRKVRSLFWIGVGLALIAAHPSQAAPATDLRGNDRAHPT